MENHLIKYISNLSNYKRYSSLIRDEYLSDIPKFIYDNLKTYFNETEKQDVDWDEFKGFVLMNHPNLNDSKVKSFVAYVNKLVENDDGEHESGHPAESREEIPQRCDRRPGQPVGGVLRRRRQFGRV